MLLAAQKVTKHVQHPAEQIHVLVEYVHEWPAHLKFVCPRRRRRADAALEVFLSVRRG